MARSRRPPPDPALEVADMGAILAALVVLAAGLPWPLPGLALVLLGEVLAFRVLRLVRPPRH